MEFFLTGMGRVGTALVSFLEKKGIDLKNLNEDDSESCGILFAALPDDHLLQYINKIRSVNKHLHIIHFSGSVVEPMQRCYLFHPYASVSKESDLSEILFTLWGSKNPMLENVLKQTGFRFVYAGNRPTPFYHISAVLSGNFTQYFFNAAVELLINQGFSNKESVLLVKQLIISSLQNCEKSGTDGITGPAARGDVNTVAAEAEILAKKNDELSKIFYSINNLIFKAVKNGSVFK